MTLIGMPAHSFNARSERVRRCVESVVRSFGTCNERQVPDIIELVRDHLAIATARHGEWIATEVFAEHALGHARLDRSGFIARLATLHSADLYLALAAALDVTDAVARIEDDHLHGVAELVGRIAGGAPHAAETERRARSRLLGAMPRARLRSYSGRSSLRDWIWVCAVRELRELRAGVPEGATCPSRTGDRSRDLQQSTVRT